MTGVKTPLFGLPPAEMRPRATTFLKSNQLARHLGMDVMLASETFQHTGSFKFRGAYETAASATANHLIAASSGNFGQALACACALFNHECTIVMPSDSAEVKMSAVMSYGAHVDLIDVRTTPRAQRVRELLAMHPDAVQAFPSDGEPMLRGNESLGSEIIAHPTRFEVIVAPIGGGGVGVGCVRAKRTAESQVSVIGVEPIGANDVVRSFRSGKRFVWETEPKTIADGVRTLSVSESNWTVLRDGLSAMLEVPDAAIAEATRLLFRFANLKAEPTGALALAALLEHPEHFAGKRVCCIVTGGNVDPARYAAILNGANTA
jgi:threonine dehydratase